MLVGVGWVFVQQMKTTTLLRNEDQLFSKKNK